MPAVRCWLARRCLDRLRMTRDEGRGRAALVIQRAVRAWQARDLRKHLEDQRLLYIAMTAKFLKQVGDWFFIYVPINGVLCNYVCTFA